MDSLPRYLLRAIFLFAGPEEALTIQLLCKKFYQIISEEEEIWHSWCISKFPEYFSGYSKDLCAPRGSSWKWLALCLVNVVPPEKLRMEKFTGYGCKTTSPRSFYAGGWKDSRYDGLGVRIHKFKKHRQIGTFRNGMLQGHGVLLIDEDLYIGQFHNGKKNGHGFHQYPNNRSYNGDWVDNRQSGKGVFIWGSNLDEKDQERYEGEFLNSRRHGHGVYIWPTGDHYCGGWREGHQHGKGVYHWSSGSSFDGMWEDDAKHGFGIFRWANGDTFAGEWLDGFPVDMDRATHPRIKVAIDKQVCTRTVAGLSCNLGQVYYFCNVCQIRCCVVCKKKCHLLHESQKLWSSLNNCGCFCRLPHPE